ncbi:unnamed protein product [Aspergillus oryzae RIB40]|uniref:DNA, SC102 n=1 Tax=Aspergillus oryzae (strain ATCC 42149 / RIB 40) TaxID=510516 RepID=Q2UAF4_ASPOR|nr:unnamed protein product [Aspergillus oryzae RIB40]BAE61461.1 unnamed protein product [Aspergillus oryzae RIB40]
MSLFRRRKVSENSSRQAKPFRYVEFCQNQTSASLCEHQARKVRVDCCFLFSKTQWGQLDDRDSGLMYLDLTFHQPSECKLANATITMTFNHTNEQRGGLKDSVEVTEFFGPQMLSGEKKERHISKCFYMNPKFGAANASFEGVGGSRTSDATLSSRWKFTGSRFTVNDPLSRRSNRAYRQLVWHLEENDLERQAIHNPVIHTALAFHHQSKPFYLDLEIKAKLHSWHHRFKQHLVYPPPSQVSRTRAKIDPGVETDPFFAKTARNLNRSMIEANLHPVTEVSDPKPTMELPDQKDESTLSLPGHDLLALAQQLTGQRVILPKQTLAVHNPETHPTPPPSTISNSSTKVESTPNEHQPDKPAPITLDAYSSNPVEPKTVMMQAPLLQISQLLTALLASLIVGLSKLHSDLARAGKGSEGVQALQDDNYGSLDSKQT